MATHDVRARCLTPWRRSPVRVVVIVGRAPLLAGCGIEHAAQIRLAEQAESVHRRALIHRFGHPSASRSGAADVLGLAVAGSTPDVVVSADETEDGLELISMVAAQVSDGGWPEKQETWGACLRTTADAETVETRAGSCPDGVWPQNDGRPVDATTTGLNRLSRPMSEGRRRTPCSGVSGDCGGGG